MLGGPDRLTRGRLLAGNVGLNLAGWVLPAAVALAAVPALLREMGQERFGLLSLVWTLVGYFGVFDLGVGRALTHALAERAGAGAERDSVRLTWTALWLMFGIGLGFGAAVWAAAPAAAEQWLHVSPALRGEAEVSVRLVAVAVPLLVVTSGLRGVLEAGQRFRTLNALRIPLGVATYAGPLAVQAFGRSLPAAVAVLVAARALTCVLHAAAAVRAHRELAAPRAPRRADLARLGRLAGWMTVSSVVSPVLVSADRFVIGAALPVGALGHYAAASEVASKLGLFTAALQPVLFPALAATARADPRRAVALFERGVRATVLAVGPAALVVVLFAHEGLAAWVGPGVAGPATPLLRWLAVAVFANAVAAMPHTLLQAAGRADRSAVLHLLELPGYLAALWLLLHWYGLPGVAAAWVLRMVVDALAQFWAASALPGLRAAAGRGAALVLGTSVLLAACGFVGPLGARVAVAAACAGLYVLAAPRLALGRGARWRDARTAFATLGEPLLGRQVGAAAPGPR